MWSNGIRYGYLAGRTRAVALDERALLEVMQKVFG